MEIWRLGEEWAEMKGVAYYVVDLVRGAVHLVDFKQMVWVVESFEALLLTEKTDKRASSPDETVAEQLSLSSNDQGDKKLKNVKLISRERTFGCSKTDHIIS